MRQCPSCGGKTKNMKGTRHLICELCRIKLVHEGNGFIMEYF